MSRELDQYRLSNENATISIIESNKPVHVPSSSEDFDTTGRSSYDKYSILQIQFSTDDSVFSTSTY